MANGTRSQLREELGPQLTELGVIDLIPRNASARIVAETPDERTFASPVLVDHPEHPVDGDDLGASRSLVAERRRPMPGPARRP